MCIRDRDLPIGTYVDVIGIAREIFPLKTVKLKNEMSNIVRNLKLFNTKGKFIYITLWQSKANIAIEENTVAVFEGMKISQYKNKKQLNSTTSTNILQQIKDYDTADLQLWAAENFYINPSQSLKVPSSRSEIMVSGECLVRTWRRWWSACGRDIGRSIARC
eukprot:TRINITY_DN13716_c0_g3_i1.p1 TRINITY_DN13716_c0_g3~~TRINITY_DN13716_c0_g3_i1.p1  ORF type:complete len:162 (+),score=19.98 TRINITY_DN13716_c0_g3_i1:73-558(+)